MLLRNGSEGRSERVQASLALLPVTEGGRAAAGRDPLVRPDAPAAVAVAGCGFCAAPGREGAGVDALGLSHHLVSVVGGEESEK